MKGHRKKLRMPCNVHRLLRPYTLYNDMSLALVDIKMKKN